MVLKEALSISLLLFSHVQLQRPVETLEVPPVPGTFQSSIKIRLNKYNLKSYSTSRVNFAHVKVPTSCM